MTGGDGSAAICRRRRRPVAAAAAAACGGGGDLWRWRQQDGCTLVFANKVRRGGCLGDEHGGGTWWCGGGGSGRGGGRSPSLIFLEQPLEREDDPFFLQMTARVCGGSLPVL